MKKFIKAVIGIFAALAAVAGVLYGLKLWFEKKGRKADSEEFVFEGDDLDELEAEEETEEEAEEDENN